MRLFNDQSRATCPKELVSLRFLPWPRRGAASVQSAKGRSVQRLPVVGIYAAVATNACRCIDHWD